MNTKSFVWGGFFIGSTVGQLIPLAWGGSSFSFSSVFLSALFGMLGIYLGYKIAS